MDWVVIAEGPLPGRRTWLAVDDDAVSFRREWVDDMVAYGADRPFKISRFPRAHFEFRLMRSEYGVWTLMPWPLGGVPAGFAFWAHSEPIEECAPIEALLDVSKWTYIYRVADANHAHGWYDIQPLVA